MPPRATRGLEPRPPRQPCKTAGIRIVFSLAVRDETCQIPRAYFGWTEGNPIAYMLTFVAFGEDDTAPVTREVLRQAEPAPLRRPRIHVG